MPLFDSACRFRSRTLIALVVLALAVLAGWGLFCCLGNDGAQRLKLTPAEWQWLALNGNNLRVSAEPYAPPLAMDQNGRLAGMASDYYRLIEKRLNIKLKYVPAPSFAEMLAMAKTGQIDIVGPIAKTATRSQYLLYSQPVIEYPAVIVVEHGNRRDLSLKDLRGLRIAVTRGYAVWDYLWRDFPELDYVPVKDDGEGLRMVAFKRVDACLVDLGTASYTITRHNLGNLRIAGQIDFKYVLSFASRRDQPVLNAILIKTMASISAREQAEIYRRWMPLEFSPYYLKRSSLIVLSGLLLAVLVGLATVSAWNIALTRRVNERTAELNAYRDRLEVRVAERTAELVTANADLAKALDEVRMLSGFIPICCCCRKLRDDEGYWKQVEDYLAQHSNALVTHGICPDCLRKNYPEYADDENSPDDVGKA